MSKWFLATTAAVAMGLAPGLSMAQTEPVEPAEQCLEDLMTFERTVVEEQQADAMGPNVVLAGSEFRQLREAARVFANNGNEDACQMIIEEMRALYEQRREAVEQAITETDQAETEQRNQRLVDAVAVDQRQGLVRADQFVGAEVRNPSDQYLGEIETIVLDPQENQVAYVLMAHGGFIGIGTELVPIRWADLHVTQDGETYVLNASEEDIANAPTIDPESFNPKAGEDWRQQIDQWWDSTTSG